MEAPETSEDESDYDASDASDDYSGSGSGSGDAESDEGGCTSLCLAVNVHFCLCYL